MILHEHEQVNLSYSKYCKIIIIIIKFLGVKNQNVSVCSSCVISGDYSIMYFLSILYHIKTL